ncbi:MAG: pyridoxamine 5'-phosphate oxidase family protein [Stackebrandtia sp.]
MTFVRTHRTTSLRVPEKLRYDKDVAFEVLDAGYICHLAYSTLDGPMILPTFYVRVDETLYIHGSTGCRLLLAARDSGVSVSFATTLHDGFVYSRSWFHHSANYRCVVAHGRAHLVVDPEQKLRALAALVDRLAPGRSEQSRPPTDKELSQTGVLALPLTEVSVKTRSGGPGEDPDDLDLPYWAGVVPLHTVHGTPVGDDHVKVDVPSNLPR